VKIYCKLDGKRLKIFSNYFGPLYHGMNQHGASSLVKSLNVVFGNTILVMSFGHSSLYADIGKGKLHGRAYC
jgi:hypothetical protein